MYISLTSRSLAYYFCITTVSSSRSSSSIDSSGSSSSIDSSGSSSNTNILELLLTIDTIHYLCVITIPIMF